MTGFFSALAAFAAGDAPGEANAMPPALSLRPRTPFENDEVDAFPESAEVGDLNLPKHHVDRMPSTQAEDRTETEDRTTAPAARTPPRQTADSSPPSPPEPQPGPAKTESIETAEAEAPAPAPLRAKTDPLPDGLEQAEDQPPPGNLETPPTPEAAEFRDGEPTQPEVTASKREPEGLRSKPADPTPQPEPDKAEAAEPPETPADIASVLPPDRSPATRVSIGRIELHFEAAPEPQPTFPSIPDFPAPPDPPALTGTSGFQDYHARRRGILR